MASVTHADVMAGVTHADVVASVAGLGQSGIFGQLLLFQGYESLALQGL